MSDEAPRPLNPYSPGMSPAMGKQEVPPNGTEPVGTSQAEIDHLRAQAALADSALRQNLLLSLGIDPTSPVGKMFQRALERGATPEEIAEAARGLDPSYGWG
jgi:hypothetical protein